MARDEVPQRADVWHSVKHEEISRDDIAFTHAVLAQCFLPLRPLPKGESVYQVENGRALLRIKAGELIHPEEVGKVEPCEVPAGSKARLLFAYINDQAIRTGSPVINLGTSMRHFMEHNGVPIGGRNGKEITRQLRNIAAASVLIAGWQDDHAKQVQTHVAGGMSFWLERDPNQALLWQPEMQLSEDYFRLLRSRKVPIDFRALVALQTSPRAMDIYTWLAYRLHNLRRPTKISWADLKSVFGRGISSRDRRFKQLFLQALVQVIKCYPDARLKPEADGLLLFPSPPAVPRYALKGRGGVLPRGHGPKAGTRKKAPQKRPGGAETTSVDRKGLDTREASRQRPRVSQPAPLADSLQDVLNRLPRDPESEA